MLTTRIIGALVVCAGFLVTGCSASGGPAGASSAPTGQVSGSAVAGSVVVGTANSASLGTFLIGPNGNTLYTHAGDGPNTSTCAGDCATAWPPLTVAAGGQATAGAGATGTLGTLTRADGTTQVTYGGLPLYYWQGDAKPGDITGDGVNGFSVAKVSGTVAPPSAAPTKYGY